VHNFEIEKMKTDNRLLVRSLKDQKEVPVTAIVPNARPDGRLFSSSLHQTDFAPKAPCKSVSHSDRG
jgi:hypothetical protein